MKPVRGIALSFEQCSFQRDKRMRAFSRQDSSLFYPNSQRAEIKTNVSTSKGSFQSYDDETSIHEYDGNYKFTVVGGISYSTTILHKITINTNEKCVELIFHHRTVSWR